jgi:hypothetical protein
MAITQTGLLAKKRLCCNKIIFRFSFETVRSKGVREHFPYFVILRRRRHSEGPIPRPRSPTDYKHGVSKLNNKTSGTDSSYK